MSGEVSSYFLRAILEAGELFGNRREDLVALLPDPGVAGRRWGSVDWEDFLRVFRAAVAPVGRGEDLIAAGRRLLASAADPAELAKALRYARPGPAPSPADWLAPRDGKGTPLLLRIRKSLPVRLRDGPGRLVTVEDLSPLRRLAEEGDARSARERRQIGRDLHDGLSQLLTFLSVGSKALEIEASRAGIETAPFKRIARRARECVETAAKLTRRFE